MDNLKVSSFEFEGAQVSQGAQDPNTFYYVPGSAGAELGPNGKPAIILWVSDQGAILQLGTQWSLSGEQVERLRAYIHTTFNVNLMLIRIATAAVTVREVSLMITDGTGGLLPLQTKASSALSPYNALFNVQLTSEQKTRAQAAFGGRENCLQVIYHCETSSQIELTTTITGDARRVLAKISTTPSFQEYISQIDAAIGRGELTLTHVSSATVADDQWVDVDLSAKRSAALILSKAAKESPPTTDLIHFEAKTSKTIDSPLSFERMTDIATWFPNGDGLNYVRPIGGNIPAQPAPPNPEPTNPPSSSTPLELPAQVESQLKLGFEAVNLPVTYIQATIGNQSFTLQSPAFEPVTLPVLPPEAVAEVQTIFTNGTAPYTSKIPANQLESLSPDQVGLLQMVVDGTALQESQATRARVRVRYHNVDFSNVDDRMVYLKDEIWREVWYVTTNGKQDGISISYEWSETGADGSSVVHPVTRTDHSEIILHPMSIGKS